MNAMGYYSSYTENLDGSRISYIHNKPTREESTIIWQSSASGFFLSTDGGVTWASGWDANGNAVLNILYAIGIVCDWIKGGTLTLGGDNNVNGLMRVLNAAGSQVCKIDQTGIDVIAGTIGGMRLSESALSSFTNGLNGVLIDAGNGLVEWSWNNRFGSWSKIQSGANFGAGKMEHMIFWTGAGGSTGTEGIWVTNNSPSTEMGSYIRVGSQQVKRSDGQYAQWGGDSDRRLKKNIVTITTDFVRGVFKKLNPVAFRYNGIIQTDTQSMHYGLIAQEVEELFEDKTAFVKERENGYKYIEYAEFHGLELAAIKDLYEKSDEQQTEIDDLKNTVSKQRAEIDELKQRVKILMEKVGV